MSEARRQLRHALAMRLAARDLRTAFRWAVAAELARAALRAEGPAAPTATVVDDTADPPEPAVDMYDASTIFFDAGDAGRKVRK
jgi:hypothetical protein